MNRTWTRAPRPSVSSAKDLLMSIAKGGYDTDTRAATLVQSIIDVIHKNKDIYVLCPKGEVGKGVHIIFSQRKLDPFKI